MESVAVRPAAYARLLAVPAIWGGSFVAGKHVDLVPVFGVAISVVLLGESLLKSMLIGG